jgi:ATP/maltotriose-dependent transcriptional regulator MalT
VLESLAGSNLLLVPLDRRREWYCYHHLFRDLLRAELERREPELVPKLHQRAAVWCEANGLEETAIDHAKAAGDADQIARLVLQVMQPVWASGRGDLNQALLQLAHAYIALGDPDGAHAVLRQADDIFQQRLNLGMLPAQAKELRTRVTTMKQTGLGASSLTTAELRLLPLQPTYLSFREIGERLFVSQHTVKFQAVSIYRKLGVSSRGEAIQHAQQFGLLGR